MRGLVAAIGPKGVKYGLLQNTRKDQERLAEAAGAELVVIDDTPVRATDMTRGLAVMRQDAVCQALHRGFDWLLVLDNDVRPSPDLATRLLTHDKDIIVPKPYYPNAPEIELGTFRPQPNPLTGVHKCIWSVLSAVMFSRAALEALTPLDYVFPPLVGECAMFNRWRTCGVHAYIDLDAEVHILEAPHGWTGSDLATTARLDHRKHCSGRIDWVQRRPYLMTAQCQQCGAMFRYRAPGAWAMLQNDQVWETDLRYYDQGVKVPA